MLCGKCGGPNAEGSWFCSKCGAPLAVQQGVIAPAVPAGTHRAEPSRSTTAAAPAAGPVSTAGFDEEAWRAAIGPTNSDYYLGRFAARHASGKAARWHWPAFFITFYWLLYRKLWGWAALYFVLPYVVLLVVGGVAAAVGASGAGSVGVLWLLTIVACFIVPPLVANQIYFARCRTLIERQQSSARSREHFLAQVEARGGTSHVVAIVVGVFVVIALIGILAAIALPAYSDYTRRAKVAEAIAVGRQVAVQVGEHYQRTGALPAGLDQLPQQPAANPHVSTLRLDPASGVIEIGVRFGGAAKGGSVYLVPSKETDGRLSWGCKAPAEMQRSVPAACRDR
jgi:hypothetical protein